MTVITDLPLELLLSIIEYLDNIGADGSSFASVDKNFSRVLLKKARKIFIGTDSPKWKNDDMKSRLLQMIENPYHQLSVWNDSVDDFDSIFSLAGIKSLRVDFGEDCTSQLSILQENVKAKRFFLKVLDIYNGCPYEAIPCLESLFIMENEFVRVEELNIPAYNFLRSLTLVECMNLEDVSSLDGIHNLQLDACPKIRDIQSLNSNYRVSIISCSGIKTYSKSFHFSHSVHIYIEDSQEFPLCLENCHSITSLNIHSTAFTFSDIYMKSLRFLCLSKVQNISSLPPNRLQKVDILYCDNFISLENMDNIRSISLIGLKLTTLDGLGPKNQIVTLHGMENLKDFNALREAMTINITRCPLTLDTMNLSLFHVKELSIRFMHNQNLTSIPFLKSLKRLKQLKDLKVLKLSLYVDCTRDNNDIKSLIFMTVESLIKFILHNVEKFVLSEDFFKLVGEEFNEDFLVTRRVNEVIILRKIR